MAAKTAGVDILAGCCTCSLLGEENMLWPPQIKSRAVGLVRCKDDELQSSVELPVLYWPCSDRPHRPPGGGWEVGLHVFLRWEGRGWDGHKLALAHQPAGHREDAVTPLLPLGG